MLEDHAHLLAMQVDVDALIGDIDAVKPDIDRWSALPDDSGSAGGSIYRNRLAR